MRRFVGARCGVLYVAPGDPWSPWANSGFIRRLCLEMRETGVLLGAIWPGARSDRELSGPGPFHVLRSRLRRRFGHPAMRQRWDDEREGVVGEVLRRLPPGTPVIYHYLKPAIDDSLPLRRFLFLDITVRDAARTKSYGHGGLSEEQICRLTEEHRQTLERVEGVLTFSTYAADSIAAEYGFPRQRIMAVGAGPVRPVGRIAEPAIKRYARRDILFVGRNWERKGGPILLEAFKRVREKINDATLTIVGPKIRPSVEPGVRFIGLTSDRKLRQCFARASVFCMPAVCETWGLVYGEAAYAGLPIVGFDAWALPDIVENGRTGRLVAEQSSAALAQGLIEVLSDPERMLQMGVAARRRVLEVLDWPHVVRRLAWLVARAESRCTQPVLMRTAKQNPNGASA